MRLVALRIRSSESTPAYSIGVQWQRQGRTVNRRGIEDSAENKERDMKRGGLGGNRGEQRHN